MTHTQHTQSRPRAGAATQGSPFPTSRLWILRASQSLDPDLLSSPSSSEAAAPGFQARSAAAPELPAARPVLARRSPRGTLSSLSSSSLRSQEGTAAAAAAFRLPCRQRKTVGVASGGQADRGPKRATSRFLNEMQYPCARRWRREDGLCCRQARGRENKHLAAGRRSNDCCTGKRWARPERHVVVGRRVVKSTPRRLLRSRLLCW